MQCTCFPVFQYVNLAEIEIEKTNSNYTGSRSFSFDPTHSSPDEPLEHRPGVISPSLLVGPEPSSSASISLNPLATSLSSRDHRSSQSIPSFSFPASSLESPEQRVLSPHHSAVNLIVFQQNTVDASCYTASSSPIRAPVLKTSQPRHICSICNKSFTHNHLLKYDVSPSKA